MVAKSQIKRVKTEKVAIIHSCTQEEHIKRQGELLGRLATITLGNGRPEDGLLFRFGKFMDEHKIVVSDIQEIKQKLSTVNEINTELEVQRRVKDEIAKLVSETADKKKFSWSKFSIIIAAVSFAVFATFQVLNYFKSDKVVTVTTETNKKIDDMGTPVVTTPRGVMIPLPDSAKIKFYPKDFLNDSIK
jgi:hypothetical protein